MPGHKRVFAPGAPGIYTLSAKRTWDDRDKPGYDEESNH